MNDVINKLLKKFPNVWPLQQAIAINPLESMQDHALTDVASQFTEVQQFKLTMALQEYIDLYLQGEIKKNSLHEAINEITDNPATAKQLLSYMLTQTSNQNLRSQSKQLPSKDDNANILIAHQLKPYFYTDSVEDIRQQCLTWIIDYFSSENSASLFVKWRDLMPHKNASWHAFLQGKPAEPEAFISEMLLVMQVPDTLHEQYLFQALWQLKGWTGYAKWQSEYDGDAWKYQLLTASDILCLWLAYEAYELVNLKHSDQIKLHEQSIELNNPSTVEIFDTNLKITSNDILWIWQRALELTYQNQLIEHIEHNLDTVTPEQFASAQWVFCIDTRSEGIRRHLEQIGNHKTYGFAGFFGCAFELDDPTNQKATYQCPALLTPDQSISIINQTQTLLQLGKETIYDSIQKAKKGALSTFVLFELIGFWAMLLLIIKNYLANIIPIHRLADNSSIELNDVVATIGIQNAVATAKSLLATLPIREQFSPFVILCGHGSVADNNPFQALLNCGACGGNSGLSNAVVACQIFNHIDVRAALKQDGIEIPEHTVFIAAMHNTTTDTFVWHENKQTLSETQLSTLNELKADAQQAGKLLAKERALDLPGNAAIKYRYQSWSEIFPELGLANNAAMIIGPRELSKGLDLHRRVFLHSYHPDADPDGSILESIFLAPMVVAHGINMQYYCSSIAPDIYSSGNKVIHNVISHVGVMEGNSSDLKFGLPLQSIFYQDQRLHQPLRLFVLVYAKQQIVTEILQKNPQIQQLIDGQWLTLKVLEH